MLYNIKNFFAFFAFFIIISIHDAGDFECDATSVQSFIDQKATSEIAQKIMTRSFSEQMRWIPPHTAITEDYRSDRINLYYDNAFILIQINCG